LIKTSSVFRQFTVGFTDPCHEHVDFVDVGEGKEMADEKLKSNEYPPLTHSLTPSLF
jgi:hypothetical protein